MSKNPRGANSRLILGLTVWSGRTRFGVRLETATVPNRRRRRLLDGHQHVVLGAAAVRQLGDLHPAEEAERAQPPPALELILQADRLARLELQLAQDDVGFGVHIPDDQDVVDDALRSLLDRERQVDPRAIVARGQADARRTTDAKPRLRYSSTSASRASTARGSKYGSPELILMSGRSSSAGTADGSGDPDLAHRRPRPLDDDDPCPHQGPRPPPRRDRPR